MYTTPFVHANHHKTNAAAVEALLGMGLDMIKPRPYSGPAVSRKCMLAGCDIMTTHNGGYCSPDHCKLHRQQMKASV